MKNIDEVIIDISKKNINIDNMNIERKGMILKYNNKNHICINENKIQNTNEKKYVLAEEYNHLLNGTLYAINAKYETISRLEKKNLKSTIKYLIPKEEIKNAILAGNYYYYELAEHFGVPEQLIKDSLDLYGIDYEIELEEELI